MSEPPRTRYRFDRFTAEPRTARLLRGGEAVAIEPKVLRILFFLLENRYRLVEKQEILDVVWHDAVVTENALTRAMARLRKILGDNARVPRYVETVHSRGYRFVAEVEVIEEPETGSGEAPPGQALALPADAAPENPLPSRPRISGRRLAAAGLALLGFTVLGLTVRHWSSRGTEPSPAAQTLDPPAALRRVESAPTRVISAWDHYLRGREFYQQRTRVGLESAIEQYRRALELDPDFALAYAELANSHAFRALMFEQPPDWPAAAIAAAERALEIDPELAPAYRALGAVSFSQTRLQRAFELTMKAVELDPGQVDAVYNASSYAQMLGRLDEAVLLQLRSGGVRPLDRAIVATNLWTLGFEPQARKLARQVLEEEPMSIYLNLHMAQREMLAGDLAAARRRLERLGRAYPDWPGIWQLLGRVEVRAGRDDAALEQFARASEAAGGDYPMAEVRSAWIRAQRGEQAEIRTTLERLAAGLRDGLEPGNDMWNDRWQLAAVEAVRGHFDEAVRWLTEAVDLGYFCYYLDASDPIFEPLRGDPRFGRQLERMRTKVTRMRERLVLELGPDLNGLSTTDGGQPSSK